MTQRPMRPDDIERVAVVEELDLSRDGYRAVVARRTIRRGRYESHLHIVDLGTRSTPVALTSGRVRDSAPKWSPDGSTVAFLRKDPDDENAPSKLCTVSIRRGSIRTIAPRGANPGLGAISEVAWSPNGSTIAFTAEAGPPISIVGERPPVGSRASRSPKLQAPTARRMTRTDWRWDEQGHRDRWTHLFAVATTSGSAPRQVTNGDWGVSDIAWHPDGRTVAFVADRGDDADLFPRNVIWGVDVDAGPRSKRSRPRVLLDVAGGARRPAFSPDGRWLAAVGVVEPGPLDDVAPGLLLGRSDATGSPTALGPELDRPIGNWCDTDLHGWMVYGRQAPAWLDERTIVAIVSDRGRSLPERWIIDPESGDPLVVPQASDRSGVPWAEATAHSLVVVPASGTAVGVVAVLGTLAGRAMDLMTLDMTLDVADEPRVRRFRHHTTFGSAWQRAFVQPEMRRVDVAGTGGPIETWIASPPGAGSRRLPVVVDVHGGPLGGWAPAPSIEVIQLVGAGYRVVLPNIRGGASYGRDWIRPQLGDWGGVDADDVHAAVDHVVDAGLADGDRLGIMGLSYGGFMVNWMIGTTERFAAAVSENGVTNQMSCWANSDCGPAYCRTSLLGDPLSPEGVEQLWRQSPLRNVADVHTPLLMLQAEADLRCPPQDNEQFFIALRHLGRTVEYVLYPEESHVYASIGRPDRRIDRMRRVLEWFGQHLA